MASSPESLLISAVITNKTKRPLDQANFSPDNMSKYSEHLFFIMQSKNIPSKKAFRAKFPTFVLQKVPQTDMENLIGQCKERKLRQDVTLLLRNSARQLGNGEEAYRVLQQIQKQAQTIDGQFTNATDIEVMSNLDMLLTRFVEKADAVESGNTIGIPYGVPTIDRLTGGMQKGELETVAARTKVGKTWWLCKGAASALKNESTPLFFSLEMDWDAVANRIFAILSYELAKKRKDKEKYILKNHEMNMGKLSRKQVGRVIKEIRDTIKGELYVPDLRNRMSIAGTRTKIDALEPDIVFFDYFGLTQQAGGKGIDNWVQASDASKLCKEIARQFAIPYVLGAQINRTGAQADSPGLEHIALTDSIGQDSDKVFMLRPTSRRQRLQLICEKLRSSFDGWKITFDFDPNNGKIEERSVSGLDDEIEDLDE